MWLSLQVKPEFSPESPANFWCTGIRCFKELGSDNHTEGKQEYSSLFYEYFVQKDISGLLDETLETACLFHNTKVDGHGIISALIVMTILCRELEYLDEDRAFEIVSNFQKKKRGKSINLRGIDFLKSFLNITDKEILKQHDDMPLFDTDTDLSE